MLPPNTENFSRSVIENCLLIRRSTSAIPGPSYAFLTSVCATVAAAGNFNRDESKRSGIQIFTSMRYRPAERPRRRPNEPQSSRCIYLKVVSG